MTLSVIIPAYNERATIREVIERVKKADSLGLKKEIIVVDDASKDGTQEIIQELREADSTVRAIFHERNLGVGAAWRDGIAISTGDILLRQDADTEYQPEDFPLLLRPILEEKADIVYGSRILGFDKSVYLYKMYLWGGFVVNWLINCFIGTRLTDTLTASKAFHKRIFEKITLESKHFEIEAELTAKARRAGLRIIEVPITYRARSFEEGKKIRWHHAFPLMKAALWYRFARLK